MCVWGSALSALSRSVQAKPSLLRRIQALARAAPAHPPSLPPMSRPGVTPPTTKRRAGDAPPCDPGPSAPATAPPAKRARPSTAAAPAPGSWQQPSGWPTGGWGVASGSPAVVPAAPPPPLERRRSSSAPPPDVRSGSEWSGGAPGAATPLALVPYAPPTVDAATVAARLRGEAALHARFARPPPPPLDDSEGDGGGGMLSDGTPMDE